jgi:alcohol dehydrogenase (NADP+)
MESLVGKGTRYIGLANFSPKQLKQVLDVATIKPKVVQVELHPYLPQEEYLKFIQGQGISAIGYAPLGNTNPVYGRMRDRETQLLSHQSITTIAQVKGCTPAQVVLAWNMDRDVVVIPKAGKIEHQKENLEAFEKCKLDDEDVKKIGEISKKRTLRLNGDLCNPAPLNNACWETLASPA